MMDSREMHQGTTTINPSCCWKDRKSTRLNSSHQIISYAVFCLKKKKRQQNEKHTIVSTTYYSKVSEQTHTPCTMRIRSHKETSRSVSADRDEDDKETPAYEYLP